MNKTRAMGLLVGSLILATSTVTWAGGVYRWVDEKGVTHFGEKPPAPGVGERIRVNAAGPSEATPTDPKKSSTPAAAAAATSAPTPAEAAQVKANAEIIKKNCESYTANLKVLQEHGQIREATVDGQVKMLTDEEKQGRINEAQKYLTDKCQNTGK